MGLIPTLVWLRMKWDTITKDGSWSLWPTVDTAFLSGQRFIVGWGYWADWDGFWGILWWIVNGSLAAAYGAAVFMSMTETRGNRWHSGETRVSREVVIPTPSLIASAVRYPGKAPRIHNAGNQAWQRDCYRHYAICGEARAAARFMGRALSHHPPRRP